MLVTLGTRHRDGACAGRGGSTGAATAAPARGAISSSSPAGSCAPAAAGAAGSGTPPPPPWCGRPGRPWPPIRTPGSGEIAGGDPSNVDGRTAFEGLRRGDAVARQVVEQYLDYLAEGVTDLINLLQPTFLCIGGGLSHEDDAYLLHPLQRRVETMRFDRDLQRQHGDLQGSPGQRRRHHRRGAFGPAVTGAIRREEEKNALV